MKFSCTNGSTGEFPSHLRKNYNQSNMNSFKELKIRKQFQTYFMYPALVG